MAFELADNLAPSFVETSTSYPFDADPLDWLEHVFPMYVTSGFAPHHVEFWSWLWSITLGEQSPPFVGIWPRGHGKSTSAELACAALGARGARRYVLYVCATQAQADNHVQSIAAMLESSNVATYYADLGTRAVGKYGSSRGWRRNRLRAANGYTIDAIGLDTAARGIKIEDARPDMIVLDDIDQESDTPDATKKKIRRLTHAILPAGSDDVTVLAVQNLVLPDGVFARLSNDAEESADFLADRIVSGPHPAVDDFAYEIRDGKAYMTGGTPTWPGGMDEDAVQREINTTGLDAFLSECQHEVRLRGSKAYSRDWWTDRARYDIDDETIARLTEFRIMAYDTAEEAGEKSAYTALVVFDVIPWQRAYAALVRHVWRDRVDSGELLPLMLQHIDEFDNGKLSTVLVEFASSGKMLTKQLKLQAPPNVRRLITGYPPRDSKDARQYAAAMPCRYGRVWLPYPHERAPWLAAFTSELYAVPQSTYRDQTDAFAMGTLWLRNYLRTPEEARADDRAAA